MTLITAAFLATLSVTDLRWDVVWGSPPSTTIATRLHANHPLQKALLIEGRTLLSAASLEGVVTARIKSPESLRAKAARKGLRPDQVLDRLGLRLVVDSVEDCYAALAAVQRRYAVIAGSEDDYIAVPKANGYQSLHLATQTPIGTAEIQIRTHQMHAHAEHGGAAHWRYKRQCST